MIVENNLRLSDLEKDNQEVMVAAWRDRRRTVAELVDAVVVWRVVGGVVEHCLLIEKISTPCEAEQLPQLQVRVLSLLISH